MSPMRNPSSGTELAPQPIQALDQRCDPAAVSAEDEAFDLLRLESSVQWLQRECEALETCSRPQRELRHLPRARQLDPIPGLSKLCAEVRHKAPRRLTARKELAPPRARDRLLTPPPRREQPITARGAIYILIAALIAGSIAYHVASDGGLWAVIGAKAVAVMAGGFWPA